MFFLFHLWNHNRLGKSSLEDPIGIIGHQLRALGHQAIWDPTNDATKDGTYNIRFISATHGYNVIVEGFTPKTLEMLGQAHGNGARFICIATEEPTEKGFNHGIDKQMVRRQFIFPHAAKFFEGIIHLVPGQHITNWFSQYAPSVGMELGYAKSLVRPESVIEPEWDFGFFGSLSPRRLSLLKRLARRINTPKAVRILGTFPNQETRDKEMQNAKVIVQIRKFAKMGLVSTSRCNTALCIGRPIIAEAHEYSKPWDEIVKFAKTEDEFLDLAQAVRAAWRSVHAWQFDKFKEKLSPQACIGEALRIIGCDGVKRAA